MIMRPWNTEPNGGPRPRAGAKEHGAGGSPPPRRILRASGRRRFTLCSPFSRPGRCGAVLAAVVLAAGFLVPMARAQLSVSSGATNMLDQRKAGAAVTTITAGVVSAIAVRSGGAGYTAPPLVTIQAPTGGGSTATATAVLTGGVVTSITINSGGTTYAASPLPTVTLAPPVVPGGPPLVTPQYAGMGATSATSGAVSATLGITAGRYPRAVNASIPASPVVTAVLTRSTFGHSFASGAPLYSMGEEIQRPSVRWDGNTVTQAYWRTQPVQPGETFSPQGDSNLGPLSSPSTALIDVLVLESKLGNKEVTVSNPPPTLVSGVGMLGTTVASISGNNVILVAGADRAITPPTAVTVQFTPYQPYYYSPHADRVFATQPGRVTITWVSAVPDTSKPGEVTPSYKLRRETFSVASATVNPVRPMFWTEKAFDAPFVRVPDRIQRANPIYNSFVPAGVFREYTPPGANEGTVGTTPERRTMWFDDSPILPSLRAYNAEGRIFVEYLGPERPGTGGLRQFLGADVVEVKRQPEVETLPTLLGDELRSRNTPLPEDDQLAPELVNNIAAGGTQVYGNFTRPDGVNRYFAEKESRDPDLVTIHWLESRDAAIHFLTPPAAPGLTLRWPKLKRNYTFGWPDSISQFQGVNVADTGNGPASALQFAAANLPVVIYQDDPANIEAQVDGATQRLMVDLSRSTDKWNRSLIRFNSTDGPWYVRLFIQAQTALGSPAVAAIPDPDGAGPLTGTPARAAVYTLNDQNADGVADNVFNVTVGTRLDPPSGGYEKAGYISAGVCYSAEAYLNPFEAGVIPAGNTGAIIPVNALPGRNTLTVWWMKRVAAPFTDKLQAFYVPAIAARYTVAFPTVPAPQELVIASGKGLENPALTAGQAAGKVYVQNDSLLPGFNPNEEHALMLAGNVYALRDDLNNATATSSPFVLVSYTDADGRPAMRVAKVVRSTVTYPLSYNKPAGIPLQPPMPLTALPLPLKPDGDVRNAEVPGTPDNPAGAGAPDSYRSFTFEDRKGQHWLYRGPHSGTSPSFGMRFYYYSREGFFVPGVAPQPPAGTIMPFVASTTADKINGDALALTYLPKWPDDPVFGAQAAVLGVLNTAQTLTLAGNNLPQVRGQSSAQVLYQQSIANTGAANPAVLLQDPTRAKAYAFGAVNGLTKVPSSVLTTDYAGRTYFQGLPPHLQNRFYFDRDLGPKGSLVLIGEFVDEIAGEDYLNLNALSNADVTDLKAVCSPDDTANKPKWDLAISKLATSGTQESGLTTTLEIFRKYKAAVASLTVARTAVVKATMSSQSYSINVDGYSSNGTYSRVAGFSITDGGLGYTLPPVVTLENPRPLAASDDPALSSSLRRGTASAVITTGSVSALNVTLAGGYHADHIPTVTIAPPETNGKILALTVQSGGAGYTALPDVTIDAPPNGGTRATATATIANGRVTGLVLVNPGSNYDSATPPGIVISPPAKPYAVDHALDVVVPAQGISTIIDPDTAVDSYALSSTGSGTGYVTLVFNNGEVFTDEGDPISLQIIKVSSTLYKGDLKVLLSSNPLDEQVTLRHSGDYGGKPENFEFVWRYAFPNNGAPPLAPVSDTDPLWFTPNGTWSNTIKVGGSPTAAISAPAVIMGDTYFTMKYRKIGQAPGVGWSDWMSPGQVEGWIKRVLAKITPFNQRMTDLYNNAINTDVSLLTQAGKRWEGDIALNLKNINDAGLIEIYETVLNRGKSFTVGSGIDFSSSNDALLLAAGYLNDLYTILGNEGYADAANPTISIDDQTTVTEVNTSRYAFESQVASALDEELALLGGRDNLASPGTGIAPAYNRLYWNYTRGINSGEVLYAVNYNIKEKTGSDQANGILDAGDAYRMFPQGHGDAYGHYLTALTGYYKLLTHPFFTWTPRAEAVTVLGQSILIDYKDERKFAAAAANLARAAAQIVALVHRKSYKDDVASGWTQFRDTAYKPGTAATANTPAIPDDPRNWGLDEWTSRSAQGNFFHWVTGNALLLTDDTAHNGVQKIDRSTVPELKELVSAADTFQTTMDSANAHLNPLGLSPGAIAFDISPTALKNGSSHYEQISSRALRSVLNAKGSFDQAAKMTRLLRNLENQLTDQNNAIVDQEGAFESQLIEIYGRPYAGDIGPGKTYEQGYTGPDLYNWQIIQRPQGLVDTALPVSITVTVPLEAKLTSLKTALDTGLATPAAFDTFLQSNLVTSTRQVTMNVTPNQFVQFADVVGFDGSRPLTGSLQQALLDSHLARLALLQASSDVQTLTHRFGREGHILAEMFTNHKEQLRRQSNATTNIAVTLAAASVLEALGNAAQWGAEAARDIAEGAAEGAPNSLVAGLAAGGDFTSAIRATIKLAGQSVGWSLALAGLASSASGGLLNATVTGLGMELDGFLMKMGFSQDEIQAVYEFEMLYRELLSQHYHIEELMVTMQSADQNVKNLFTTAQGIQTDIESFRQRAAAVIAGYRTRDLTFRTFRNEALEQYRTLFDLASRYTYLASKSYDYETGLLGTPEGKAVIAGIVSSRSLGDLTGDVPQATTSTLGDAGLAGSLAKLNADFSVVEGRLGINNPDQYGTLFSLRSELYRKLPDASGDSGWRQTLEQAIVPDLMSDSDVARYCNNIRKPDGSRVPGFLVSFSSIINHTDNFFGLPGAAGDHAYSPSSYSTKISSAGLIFKGYIGMDPYAIGTPGAGGPNSTDPNALRATPYAYLIPCGTDSMLAPPLGGATTRRDWTVHDQALPLPYNLGANAFNTTQFFTASGTLSEQPWILRKHQAFRPVNDPAFFYSSVPSEFTNSRLIGRSVWNTRWKIVIPAYTLLANEQDGMTRFVRSVKDIQLFLRTYSNSGN